MLTLPQESILPFAATLCAACAMLMLGLSSRLLQRHRRICPACGKLIQPPASRCPCSD